MRKLTITLLFITAFSAAKACDICGGGLGNYNPLLFPHLSKNYLSLCWMHRQYITYADDGSRGYESYNAALLTAQYSPLKRLQLALMAPWQLNKMQTLDGQKRISNIGDITFLANYRLVDKRNTKLRHTIVTGAGIKLPTGKYTSMKGEDVEGQNFQAGTGSVDYLLNASYHLGWRQWTFSIASSYKYNTQNKDEYRYGDVFVNGFTAVYQKEFKKFSLSPYVQLINEKQMKDADANVLQHHSGGQALYAGGGLDITKNKISGGFNYQFVAKQQLAEGNIIAKPRFSAHLLITL
jgi:hypothetical protein